MKKFLLIFTFVLLLFTCVACDDSSEHNNTIDISGVVFEDATFEYDGEAHSIEAKKVPSGVSVKYFGNGVTEVGEHTVTAKLSDANGSELGRLKATITITPNEDYVPDDGGDDDYDDGNDDEYYADYVIMIDYEEFELEENYEATLQDGQVAEYMAVGLYVYEGAEVTFYYLGELITQIGPENGGNLTNAADGVMSVISDNEDAQVYLKVWADGGYSVYLSKSENANVNPSEGTTVYFNPGCWDIDGAWFALYWWNDNGNGWVKVENGTVVVPANVSGFLFVRMNPAASDFSWDFKWNQTSDLTLNGTTYTINGWEPHEGSWS